MIPADISAELAAPCFMIVNDLPPDRRTFFHDHAPAAGTWRPAPPGEGGGPGTYATSLPMLVARAAGLDARAVAARLAAALGPLPWVAGARASGPGYLTVTVTTEHLAALPARIVAAGRRRPWPAHPGLPDPGLAPDWLRAWHAQHAALVLRLAGAAGRDDRDFATERHDDGNRRPPDSSSATGTSSGAAVAGALAPAAADVAVPDGVAGGPVASAVAWHGADAVRYALARTAGPRPAAIARQLGLPLDLDNPFVLVRYAHAHAASTARWAADLARAAGSGPDATAARAGAGRLEPEFAAGAGGPEAEPVAGAGGPGPESAAGAGGPEPEPVAGAGRPGPESVAGAGPPESEFLNGAAGARPEPLPAELALIGLLSWFAERLAAAARRGRPAELCAYLEQLAAAYLHCAWECPALPSGGVAAPADPAGPQAAARLELAASARVVLAAGLRLAGVSSPAELFRN